LNLLSFLKLGIDLGYFPEESRAVVDELFITTQPAHLQKGTPAKLQADERDALRADIVREKVTQIPEPNVGTAARGSMGGSQSGAVGEPDAKRDGSDEPG
jgi:protein arginine kinase